MSYFSIDDVVRLKMSSEILNNLLKESGSVVAKSMLDGGLQDIFNIILRSSELTAFESVPHFQLVTRETLKKTS